jgi:hypothetical protein
MMLSATIVEPNILSTIEFWAFQLALLIVFLSWLVRHVLHELRTLVAAVHEFRQFLKSQSEPSKIVATTVP